MTTKLLLNYCDCCRKITREEFLIRVSHDTKIVYVCPTCRSRYNDIEFQVLLEEDII